MLTRRKMLGMAAGIPLLGGLFRLFGRKEKRIRPEDSDTSEYEMIWDDPENGVMLRRSKPFGSRGLSIKILSINVRQLVKASRGKGDRFEVVVGKEYQTEYNTSWKDVGDDFTPPDGVGTYIVTNDGDGDGLGKVRSGIAQWGWNGKEWEVTDGDIEPDEICYCIPLPEHPSRED